MLLQKANIYHSFLLFCEAMRTAVQLRQKHPNSYLCIKDKLYIKE